MLGSRKNKFFFVIDQQEQKIKITVPCLYYDEERASILQIILLKRAAIKDVQVSSVDNLVVIQFDSLLLSKEGLFEVLDGVLANFSEKPRIDAKLVEHGGAVRNRSKQKIVFNVEGMSCSSCALYLEMVLSRNNYVVKVDIDYSTGEGYVIGYLSGTDIVDIIEKHGYKANEGL